MKKVLLVALLFLCSSASAFAADAPPQSVLGSLMPVFVQYVLPLLATGLLALINFGAKAGWNLLASKAKNEAVKGVLTRLGVTVSTVVLDIENTVKQDVLDAAKDGVITPDEAKKIKDDAIAKVKEHLGAQGIRDLLGVLGLDPSALDSFLGSHIEAALAGIKAKPAAPATAAEVAAPRP